jgi:hypothetical protein
MTHKTVQERLAETEKTLNEVTESLNEVKAVFPRLVDALNKSMDKRINPAVAAINALMEIVGQEQVVDKMKEQAANQAKLQLEALVKEGEYEPSDTVTTNSIVVGKEFLVDGTEVKPGRFQMSFKEIGPAFQEKLLGKGVGTELEIQNGKFVVQEIYNRAPPKTVQHIPPEEQSQEAASV